MSLRILTSKADAETKKMDAKELTLNIAVNLGRMARWASEGKKERIEQFIEDTEEYVTLLEQAPRSERFNKTFTVFRTQYFSLIADVRCDDVWAEEALTWANILTHRAKLA